MDALKSRTNTPVDPPVAAQGAQVELFDSLILAADRANLD